MRFPGIFNQAMINIRSATMRSLLALAGVLAGTAAVVTLLSCGKMATEKALMQFKSLGTELLSVTIYSKNPEKNPNENPITLEFWRKLPSRIPEINQVAPYSLDALPLSFEGKSLEGTVTGADENLADIMKLDMATGFFVSFVQSFEPYCVIGDNIAAQIRQFTQDSPIGKQLKIGSILYTITGITQPGDNHIFFMGNINQSVMVPIAGLALLSKHPVINHGILNLKPDSDIDAIISTLTNIFALHAPEKSLYITSSRQLREGMENQEKIFHLLLLVIGGVALLAGGTGIMNIMLVSVSERKKEIGLRKALGAKSRDIQQLFMIESVVLSALGGLAGILLGLMATCCIALLGTWNFRFYWSSITAGFLFSVMTGIFFGYYPAKRASRLEPVVTLKSE